jgi:hypothetical protein
MQMMFRPRKLALAITRTNRIYSTALPKTFALLPFRATFTPSTNPRSSTISVISTSPSFLGFPFSSSTLSAGTACLRLCILAFRFVRYRRSIVVWFVLGRPTTLGGWTAPGIAVSEVGEPSGEVWLSDGGGVDDAKGSSLGGGSARLIFAVTLWRGRRGIGSLACDCWIAAR